MINFYIKTILPNYRFSLTSLQIYQFVSVLFVNCSNNGWGGAIHLSNSQSNLSIIYCSFYNNQCIGSGDHGGGIYVPSSNYNQILFTCFSKN